MSLPLVIWSSVSASPDSTLSFTLLVTSQSCWACVQRQCIQCSCALQQQWTIQHREEWFCYLCCPCPLLHSTWSSFSGNHCCAPPPPPHPPHPRFWHCELKIAIVKLLLKKPLRDKNLLKIYSPISNLPFLSKILEKAILHKLLSHLQENNLSNPFQSAYQAGHSTETVLLGIVNDIPSALDNDTISVLLLDLSAAFDTIDHQILLSHLNCFGHSVYCTPMVSIIPLRYQSTSVNNSSSSQSQLMYSVPQGSILGPILFILYTIPLSDIIASHSVNHQLFTDDTQLQKSTPQWSVQPHQTT